MKKLLLIVVSIFFIQISATAQSCLPDGILFTSQEQVDNFQTNYPGCTEIEGDVAINSPSINNLNGLTVIEYMGGSLYVYRNDSLTSFTGLDNLDSIKGDLYVSSNNYLQNFNGLNSLTSIGGNIDIGWNDSLIDLMGLENLTTINQDLVVQKNQVLIDFGGLENVNTIKGNLDINSNDSLKNFNGLENLNSINGSFSVTYNQYLKSFNGLNNLDVVGGFVTIYNNPLLSKLTELNQLTSIGGNLQVVNCHTLKNLSGLENIANINGDIIVRGNDSLTSLSGLNNIDPKSIRDIKIYSNPLLCDCETQTLCKYLSAPSGALSIFSNATGCNNPIEIANTCGITLSCLPYGNYYFRSQAELNSFSVDFPACFELEGEVDIRGYNNEITDLNGLASVTSIGGGLGMALVNATQLSGLENLTSVGGYLLIDNCNYLHNLSGLNSLTSIGGAFIRKNDSLVSLVGLDNLNSSNGSIWITQNSSLTSLDFLDNLTSIGGHLMIIENLSLSSLTGLGHLTSVNSYLHIEENPKLLSLEGLGNIEAESITELQIRNNQMLSTCDVESICNYLVNQIGYSNIEGNATGCNSDEEVEVACTVGFQEYAINNELLVYPNPAVNELFIRVNDISAMKILCIYNHLGQKVFSQLGQIEKVDISAIGQGIYIVEVITTKTRYREKLIIK